MGSRWRAGMGQARNDNERAFVERLYDEAIAEGPDFINYRGKSAFLAAPRLGIDRNAYARILNALDSDAYEWPSGLTMEHAIGALEKELARESRPKGRDPNSRG